MVISKILHTSLLFFAVILSVSQSWAMETNLFGEALELSKEAGTRVADVMVHSGSWITKGTVLKGALVVGAAFVVGKYGKQWYQNRNTQQDGKEKKGKERFIEKSVPEELAEIIQKNGYQISENEWIYETNHRIEPTRSVIHKLTKELNPETLEYNNKIQSTEYDHNALAIQQYRYQRKQFVLNNPDVGVPENSLASSHEYTQKASRAISMVTTFLANCWNKIAAKFLT